MKIVHLIVAALAASLVSLGEWCGLNRVLATGSCKNPPRNWGTVQLETLGFAPFGLPKRALRALRVAWLPCAAVLALGLALVSTPAAIGLGFVAACTMQGYIASDLPGAVIGFIASSSLAACLARHQPGLALTATLTSPQLLLDVIGAFRKYFPALSLIGTDFRGTPLKLNQKYIAHIASYGSASTYDSSTGYANGANTARNGLVDVNVVVNQQPTYPLKWLHLDEIKDNKSKYEKVIAGAGYVLGKSAFDNGIAAKMNTRYFSQENVTAVADCDYDWLMALQTALNSKGVEPVGRLLLVNSAVAAVLGSDPRMISKDFAGQLVSGQGYRQWTNIAGFALIQEYPDLPSNNGSALTSVTAEADDDIITKTAHGLVTGDPFVISAMTGGTGLSTGTRYWAIKVDANGFKAASSYANAIAGTAIDITLDGSAMTVTKTENLIAFACDGRAFGFMAGIPEGFNSQLAQQLGIMQVMAMESVVDPDSKISMGVAKWQEPGTGNLFWCPTFVYGVNAGKEGDTAVASNSADANAVLAAANAAGTACDYAGLRISSGAS